MKSVRTLSRWGLVSLNGTGPYLAGYEVGQGLRCSTPLVEFNPVAGTALTSSGRPYRLLDDDNPRYGYLVAVDVWGDHFDLSKSVIVPLTVDEAVEMIVANGNEPYNRTIAEENELRRQYGIPQVDDNGDQLTSQFVTSRPDLIIPDPTDDEMDDLEGIAELDAGLGVDMDDVVAKALAIIDGIQGIPPEPGDEMPDDTDDEPWRKP